MIKQYMDTIYTARTHQPLYNSSVPYKARHGLQRESLNLTSRYIRIYTRLKCNVQTARFSGYIQTLAYVCVCVFVLRYRVN